VRILAHRVVHHTLLLTLEVFAAGRVRVTAKSLKGASRRLGRASRTTLKIPLSRGGMRALGSERRLKVRVRVAFLPAKKGTSASSASVTVTFR
jgi:hypothetical protein